MTGLTFTLKWAAGTATLQILRPHRDVGFYECIVKSFDPVPPFRPTDFVNSILIVRREDMGQLQAVTR